MAWDVFSGWMTNLRVLGSSIKRRGGFNMWNLSYINSSSMTFTAMNCKHPKPSCLPRKFKYHKSWASDYGLDSGFREFDMLVFFISSSVEEFQGKYLALFCLFSVTDDLYWFMLEVFNAPFLFLHFFFYGFLTFQMLLVTLLSMLWPASCLWQQLKLLSELESDQSDTMDCHKKCLNDVSAEKNHLISLDWTNNSSAIDVEIDWTVLEGKLFFKVLGLTHSSKLDWGYFYLLLKLPPWKFKPFFLLWSFFLLS